MKSFIKEAIKMNNTKRRKIFFHVMLLYSAEIKENRNESGREGSNSYIYKILHTTAHIREYEKQDSPLSEQCFNRKNKSRCISPKVFLKKLF